MADTLADVKIVDLEHSEIDEERSNPEKGEYFFLGEPVCVSDKSYKDASTCPPFVFKWVSPEIGGGRRIKTFRHNLHFDFVVHGEDPYYPQGADLDADGHWTYSDMVLLKCPLEIHMQRKAKQVKQQLEARKAIRRQFRQNVRQEAKDAAMTDEEIAEAIGSEDISVL